MAVTPAAKRFIHEKLSPVLQDAGWVWTPPGGVSQVRLFHGTAEEGAPYPLTVFQLMTPGNDILVINGERVCSSPIYLVKAVAVGRSTREIEPIVDGLDAVLHNTRGTVAGGLVIECRRLRPHEQPEITDGVFYSNLGGVYRLNIAEA